MVNFYIVNALGQNLANSESCPILWLLEGKSVISGNVSKNDYVCTTQWPTSSILIIKFDPSLDSPQPEFFKVIKIMVQKIHPGV